MVPSWLSPDALDAEKKSFDDRVSRLCDKALIALDKSFDNNHASNARQYALVLAILYDKRALNRGQPTIITTGIESESDDELRARIAIAIDRVVIAPPGASGAAITTKRRDGVAE